MYGSTIDLTIVLMFFRSSPKCPTTYTAKVIATERNGLENVEKKIAVAVMSISSTPISANALSMRGSIAGVSHAAFAPGNVVKSRYHSTA